MRCTHSRTDVIRRDDGIRLSATAVPCVHVSDSELLEVMSRAETRETVRRRGGSATASGALFRPETERESESARILKRLSSHNARCISQAGSCRFANFPCDFGFADRDARAPRLLRTYPQCGRLGVSPRWLRRGLRETLDRHRMCRALLVANERAVGRVVAREVCGGERASSKQ